MYARTAIRQHAPSMPRFVDDVVRSAGRPLDISTRSYFESRFGHDFSRVRIHADPAARQSARRLHALAYSVGSDVVVRDGWPSARSIRDRRVLAHELAHVVQQSGTGRTGDPDVRARAFAERVANGENVPRQIVGSAPVGLYRQHDGTIDDEELFRQLYHRKDRRALLPPLDFSGPEPPSRALMPHPAPSRDEFNQSFLSLPMDRGIGKIPSFRDVKLPEGQPKPGESKFPAGQVFQPHEEEEPNRIKLSDIDPETRQGEVEGEFDVGADVSLGGQIKRDDKGTSALASAQFPLNMPRHLLSRFWSWWKKVRRGRKLVTE
jgi:hypothetical protein